MELHLAEAARLMGLEVVEDKEEPMDKMDKPRIAQVLGVEVGERFRVESCSDSEFWVEDGALQCESKSPFHWDQDTANFISVLLDAPEFLIRKPRFTPEEVADAKALMRILGATGIERTAYGGNLCAVIGETAKVVIDQGLFPSLRPEQAISLSAITGAAP